MTVWIAWVSSITSWDGTTYGNNNKDESGPLSSMSVDKDNDKNNKNQFMEDNENSKGNRGPIRNKQQQQHVNDDTHKSDPQMQRQEQYLAAAAMDSPTTCPYQSLNDLTQDERYPRATPHRHIVDPPSDTSVHLVCCQTTKGPWNVLVHDSWAPLGAQRFLEAVNSHYFDTKVPLMRCIHKFLCQFGLNGRQAQTPMLQKTMPDDPQWLPAGPTHRLNEYLVKRFQKGYLSYAGAGPHSRNSQWFVALADDGPLGGGSPWEVPWGELVGTHSFDTLDRIYTGYGEHGPKQGWLHNHDSSDPQLAQDFPLLDYITFCRVVDQYPPPEKDGKTTKSE
ncbi:hypothetical protein ACA910_008014 [Epithemia clementina (nom. ined.)]